jgi:3-phosphoshikimate 1-carboxyvinyltransferase
MQFHVLPKIVNGKIVVPASKSDAQRAIIAASLAIGNSKISNCGTSEDVLHVLKACELLGAKVESIGSNSYIISGGKYVNVTELNVGESGLAIRLLTPIVATQNQKTLLNGKGSLLKRPLLYFEQNLPKMNVEVKSTNGFLPIEVLGPLKGGTYTVDGSQSSQYISGLLMALPLVDDASDLFVESLASKPYVQMTFNTLEKFGIQIENNKFERFLIAGKQHYLPWDYHVEGDWSAASYWLVAAALGAEITIAGLSMSSLQADKKMLDALIVAGCNLQFSSDGISVNGNEKKAFQFDATHCPDLFPALVSFAAFCPGVSVISGVKRLKNKESDRGIALKTEFEKLGVLIELREDEMYIHGKNSIEGGDVFSHHDHRIAMCLAIVGLFSKNGVTIENAEAVAKSYPDFWNDLDKLTC